MPYAKPYAELLDLTEDDFATLDRYRDVLAGDAESLAEDFYAYLLSHPATAAVFRDFSPAQLAELTLKQARHARELLTSRLSEEWLAGMAEIGALHYRLGVESAWVAGAYILYRDHWERVLASPGIAEADRQNLRCVVFRLIVGDLMAQLDGYANASHETDGERLAIFDVLLQALSNRETTEDASGERILRGICSGLVAKSRVVQWTGYLARNGFDEALTPRCLAGDAPPLDHVVRGANDPCWRAIESGTPLIMRTDADDAPAWMRALRGSVKEIACIPFGSADMPAVGLIGARQIGYFQRVGAVYFLAFAHIGDLVLRIRTQALRDPLTGLPNRQLFFERLQHDRAQSLRRERLLGVGILDLDGFKQVNDRLGHGAGDLLLQEASKRIKNLLRMGDTLARLGGDEFGLLLSDLERLDDLEAVCERVLDELRRPFQLDSEIAHVSGSLGLTIYPLDDGDAEDLLHHADLALYAAKEGGKDQYQTHTRAMDARVSRQIAQREELAQAFEEGRLLVHYQPIVATAQNATACPVIGVEALLRLDDGQGGMLPPGAFADSLDHPRLARSIGRHVLETALAQGERWHAQGLPLRVAVNVSARHLLDLRFVADLEEALLRHPGIRAAHVEIEVTESAPLADFETARLTLMHCQHLGVRTALDDFGTGNASLTYLQKLPAHTIKVDQSFVRDIVNDPHDLAIVSGIITTARMLGLEVIAEGVETPRHAQLLEALSCHALQGYLIAKPMPAAEIAPWIAQYRQHRPAPPAAALDEKSQVLAGHYHRVQQFIAALKGGESFPDNVLEADAEHKCHLGVWLQAEGQARFGNDPAYPLIQARHGRLHQLAREAKAALDAGDADTMHAKAQRLELENAALLAEIRVLAEPDGLHEGDCGQPAV